MIGVWSKTKEKILRKPKGKQIKKQIQKLYRERCRLIGFDSEVFFCVELKIKNENDTVVFSHSCVQNNCMEWLGDFNEKAYPQRTFKTTVPMANTLISFFYSFFSFVFYFFLFWFCFVSMYVCMYVLISRDLYSAHELNFHWTQSMSHCHVYVLCADRLFGVCATISSEIKKMNEFLSINNKFFFYTQFNLNVNIFGTKHFKVEPSFCCVCCILYDLMNFFSKWYSLRRFQVLKCLFLFRLVWIFFHVSFFLSVCLTIKWLLMFFFWF